MCYYKSFIFTGCGHNRVSRLPLPNRSPPCPVQASSSSLASPAFGPSTLPRCDLPFDTLPSAWELEVSQSAPIQVTDTTPMKGCPSRIDGEDIFVVIKPTTPTHMCAIRLTHPLHTYRLHKLCAPCTVARARRLTKLEATLPVSQSRHEIVRKRNEHGKQPKMWVLNTAQDKSRSASSNAKPGACILDSESGASEGQLGADETGTLLGLESRGLEKVMNSVKDWATALSSTTSPKQRNADPTSSWAVGVDTAKGSRISRSSWLTNPRLKNALNLDVGKHISHSQESLLSPEHFAVPDLLYDSRESLISCDPKG